MCDPIIVDWYNINCITNYSYFYLKRCLWISSIDHCGSPMIENSVTSRHTLSILKSWFRCLDLSESVQSLLKCGGLLHPLQPIALRTNPLDGELHHVNCVQKRNMHLTIFPLVNDVLKQHTACANKWRHQWTWFIPCELSPEARAKEIFLKNLLKKSSYNVHEHRLGVSLLPLAFLILSTLIFDYCRKEILQHTGNKKEAPLPTKAGYQ